MRDATSPAGDLVPPIGASGAVGPRARRGGHRQRPPCCSNPVRMSKSLCSTTLEPGSRRNGAMRFARRSRRSWSSIRAIVLSRGRPQMNTGNRQRETLVSSGGERDRENARLDTQPKIARQVGSAVEGRVTISRLRPGAAFAGLTGSRSALGRARSGPGSCRWGAGRRLVQLRRLDNGGDCERGPDRCRVPAGRGRGHLPDDAETAEDGFVVRAFEPQRALVLGDPTASATWALVLEPIDDKTTRSSPGSGHALTVSSSVCGSRCCGGRSTIGLQ